MDAVEMNGVRVHGVGEVEDAVSSCNGSSDREARRGPRRKPMPDIT
jgi:hypothetical protein